MLGILQHLASFWEDEDGFQLNLFEFFFGSALVHWWCITVFEMPVERFSQGREICLFLVKFFQWHRGGEREWCSNGIRLHLGMGRRRKEALWTGLHNPARPISWWRSKIRGGGVESRASAGGGSRWRGRGRGLWKRTREGRIGVVEEEAEQRRARVS